MEIINGLETAKQLRERIREEVEAIVATGKRAPHLAAILVGDDGASRTYVNSKEKDCEKVGFGSTVLRFDESISEAALLSEVEKINQNPDIDGLIVQLPLPAHIDATKVTEAIDPQKDVDGFHTISVGKLAKGEDTFISATPLGILMLLEAYGIETSGKHCVVIGRSNIVGRPMSILMSRSGNPGNCTVTLCHSRTQNLSSFTQQADILIVALGRPEFVTADMVKEGAVVIDVGITRTDDPQHPKGYSLKGDVAFEEVKDKCSWITPVPGGVGPMTRLGLLQNTLKAYSIKFGA
jgi:methylenetetrahydrofolate dehydrogenase (NADP+)/methenyltetrahydrofolate cyclohydrolase